MEVLESSSTAYENVNHISLNVVTDILSDAQRELVLIVNLTFICSIIAIFGVITNIINLIIFYKQGFTNTVNISFFGLAISDLCCLFTLLWVCVCLNPLLVPLAIPWVETDLMYLPGAWPHVTSGRITSYITVYVTAERCICVMAPLKVKDIITPFRTFTAIFLIYFLNILPLIPEYATSYYDWTFFPQRNITLLALTFRPNRLHFVGVVFFISFITGIASFIAVVFFTAVLAVKFKQTSEWRQEVTKTVAGPRGSMSARDRKTVKMVILIASFLVVCYTPGAFISMTTFIVPDFDLQKGYANIGMAMWSIACVFQATNSSVNILLYYKMSSKYREAFSKLCGNCFRRKHRNLDKIQQN